MKAHTLTTVLIAAIFTTLTGITAVTAETGTNNMKDITRAHILLGLNFAKAGDFSSAIEEFEQVILTGTGFGSHHEHVAAVYYEVGISFLLGYELDDAEKFFNRATTIENTNSTYWNALALVYTLQAEDQLEAGDRDMAQALFDRAQEMVPGFDADDAYALLNRSSRMVAEVASTSTNIALSYCAIGREYAKEDQHREAKKYYEMALAVAPDNRTAGKELDNVNRTLATFSDHRLAAAE